MSSGRARTPDRLPGIALALGSGGARGLAHIGVLEVLAERGYQVRAIAGSSMGALVGGIFAADKLREYRDWVLALDRIDVLRLVDWTISGGGFIKGDRVIGALRELVGEIDIEALPIDFTAVAVDIERQTEVWLTRGSLFDAIRASIAIPGLFRPQSIAGRLLVDGGLLNPMPIAPTLRTFTDLTVAVNVNGPERAERAPPPPPPGEPSGYTERIARFFEGLVAPGEARPTEPGWRELLARSYDTMQSALTQLKLSTHQPDLMVEIPRNACVFFEFWRAEEMIALGRARAAEALDAFEARHGAPPVRAISPPET